MSTQTVHFEIGDTVQTRITIEHAGGTAYGGSDGVVTDVLRDGSVMVDFGGVELRVRPWTIQPVCRCCGVPLSTPGSACASCIEFAAGVGDDPA